MSKGLIWLYPPGLVLRATMALDFMAITEFEFGMVRPNMLLNNLGPGGRDDRNISGCRRRGQAVHRHHTAAQLEIAVCIGGAPGLVSRPQPMGTRGHGLLFGSAGAHARQRFPPAGNYPLYQSHLRLICNSKTARS